jgi:SAM-dependent methyltransferase
VLVSEAAKMERVDLLFHKIVCRKVAGTPAFGRATYAHLLGFGRGIVPPPRHARVHVLPDGGFCPSAKSMGALACRDACLEVTRATPTRTIVDPFCGFGTVLAVANLLGLDAVGVDLSARMCRKARGLALAEAVLG